VENCAFKKGETIHSNVGTECSTRDNSILRMVEKQHKEKHYEEQHSTLVARE
jgi:hypothetical protein